MRKQKSSQILRRGSPTPQPSSSLFDSSSIHILIIILLAIIVHLPSINGDFVFDDSETIVSNGIVNGKISIWKVLDSDFWGRPLSSSNSHKSYRPITTITFWLNYQLFGQWTLPYHIVNIILHTTSTILVYHFVHILKKELSSNHYHGDNEFSFITASIFAVHPIHTESVANITGRAELLMTSFTLISLIYFLQHRQSLYISVERTVIYLALCTLAFLSKEQGIIVIPVCLLLEVLLNISKRRTASLIICLVLMVLLRLHHNNYSSPSFSHHDNSALAVKNPLMRLINYCYLWLYHLRLLILPYSLCFDYSMGCIPPISNLSDIRIYSFPLVIVLLILSFIFIHNFSDNRLFLFSVIFGILSFLPASNLLVTVGFTVAERVLYLPSVAFCILLSIGFNILRNRGISIDTLLILILSLGAYQSYERCMDWTSEYRLFKSGLQVCPNNAKIHYNLGKVLSDMGEDNKAENNYRYAIRLHPNYEQALNNLGNLLERNGQSEAAEEILTRLVQIQPKFATGWMNLAISQMNNAKYNASERSFAVSLSLRPLSADCLFNMGNLYLKTQRMELARSAWTNATRIDSNHVRSWTNLLVLMDEMGECEEVIELSSSLESIAYAPLHFQIGSCYGKMGEMRKAEDQLIRAVNIQPNNALYHANLGVLYQRWNRYDLAAAHYRNSLAIDNSSQIVRSNLNALENRLYNISRKTSD